MAVHWPTWHVAAQSEQNWFCQLLNIVSGKEWEIKMRTEPSETFGDLPKVTQIVNGKVEARTRTWSEDSFHYFSAAFKNNGLVGEGVSREKLSSLSL